MSTESERINQQQAVSATELWLIGTVNEVAVLMRSAYAAGTVLYQSTPTVMGPNDPRLRVYLRLHLHHR